jgi:hypothetical protein
MVGSSVVVASLLREIVMIEKCTKALCVAVLLLQVAAQIL